MSGFPVLDVAIGLAFVYLLLALICTTVMEWIAQIRKTRGKMLERSVQQLLNEEGSAKAVITKAFFEHPLIQALRSPKRPPSYIPGSLFAKALRDVLSRRQTEQAAAGQQVELSVGLKQTLEALARKDGPEVRVDALPDEKSLAEWYDQVMDRVSGAYKRTTRRWILLLAIGLTVIMNADTVKLAGNLWQNPTLRAYVVERAKARLEQGPPLETVEYTEPNSPKPTEPIAPDTSKSPNSVLAEEQSLLGDLFGWSGEGAALRRSTLSWLALHLLGWLVTALAVSLGAPFWFDLLNRLVNLRASGNPPPKTDEKK